MKLQKNSFPQKSSEMKVAKFFVFIFLVSSTKCSEPLIDFLGIQETHPHVYSGLSKECQKSLSDIKEGIKKNEIWALKVLDASGKSRSGFFEGNNFLLGSESGCEMLNNPKKFLLTPSKTRLTKHENLYIATKVPVEYRMFYASHTSEVQFDSDTLDFDGLHVGLCFPKSCQQKEAEQMAEAVFQSGEFANTVIYGNVKFMKTKTLKLRENFADQTAVRILL